MVTAVDTSVLLDVLLNDPRHAGPSIAALRQAANEGSLVICEAVLAEIVPTLAPADVPQFLSDWNLTFAPTCNAVGSVAGWCPTSSSPRTPNTTRNVSWPATADTTATISSS